MAANEPGQPGPLTSAAFATPSPVQMMAPVTTTQTAPKAKKR